MRTVHIKISQCFRTVRSGFTLCQREYILKRRNRRTNWSESKLLRNTNFYLSPCIDAYNVWNVSARSCSIIRLFVHWIPNTCTVFLSLICIRRRPRHIWVIDQKKLYVGWHRVITMTWSKAMPIIQIRCRLSIITLKNLVRLHNKMGVALCTDGLVLNSLEIIQINLCQGRILLEAFTAS